MRDPFREAGQRSPPGDIISDVHADATDGWQVAVDLAMTDGTNWVGEDDRIAQRSR